jgi:hypothetical protein
VRKKLQDQRAEIQVLAALPPDLSLSVSLLAALPPGLSLSLSLCLSARRLITAMCAPQAARIAMCAAP